MNFAEHLMTLRRQRGWSQEELGDQIGVTRQTVSKWEMGQSTPELEKLVELSRLFGMSIDQLVGLKETDGEGVDSSYRHAQSKVRPLGVYYEYISPIKVFGLPLIHVRLGYGPRLAKGIIAIGNCAVGVVALGSCSLGLLSFGGLSLGLLFALGGVSFGLAALGGLAVGGFAVGGCAVGQWLAIGGGAFSNYLAIGGGAWSAAGLGQEGLPSAAQPMDTLPSARMRHLAGFPYCRRTDIQWRRLGGWSKHSSPTCGAGSKA